MGSPPDGMSLLRLSSSFLIPAAALLFSSCALHLPEPKGEALSLLPVSDPAHASDRTHPVPTATTVPVYLLADNIHTGLVFDYQWLKDSGYVPPANLGKHQWVTMSWGEEVAYVQKRWLSPFQVIRALGTPSPSVMEIIPFDWKVEDVCHHQRIFVNEVPRSCGPQLAAFLNGCAVKGEGGLPVTIADSSWGSGRLIRCPENYAYYFPRICNVWTTQSLSKCGFSFNTTSALLAHGVVRQATSRKNNFRKIWDGDKGDPAIGKPSATPVL
ncbi:MAG: hypothetical protein JWO82_1177 [Akkermansiaceae bacterium]|nr:hypothetical protein [Akkermansiaceae bacterium]